MQYLNFVSEKTFFSAVSIYGLLFLRAFWRSSLIYNTSARSERYECNTTAKLATRAIRMRQKCNTSATRTTQVRHKWKILILITTRVKTFSHPCIYYMAIERLQGEEKFHTKNYLLEMSRVHAKMCWHGKISLRLTGRRKCFSILFAFSLHPNF